MKSLPDNNISIDRGKGLSAESVSGTLRQPFLGGMLYVIYNLYVKRATFRGGGVGPPCCWSNPATVARWLPPDSGFGKAGDKGLLSSTSSYGYTISGNCE